MDAECTGKSDFPPSALEPHGIEAQSPDLFLCRLLDQETEGFLAAMRDLLDGLKNPPRTLQQQLEVMQARGLPEIALRLAVFAAEIEPPPL